MGNYMSTRWSNTPTRRTVDAALSLPLSYLKGLDFAKGCAWKSQINWHNQLGVHTAQAALIIDTTDQGAPFIDITIIASGLHVTRVYLQSSPCNYGGVRWWMICPQCARRVTAVHMPPYRGYTRFLCRHCHNLSYASAQTAHDNDRGSMAGLKRILDANNRVQAAYAVLMKARSHSKKAARAWAIIQKYEPIANSGTRGMIEKALR